MLKASRRLAIASSEERPPLLPSTLQRRMPPSAVKLLQTRLALGLGDCGANIVGGPQNTINNNIYSGTMNPLDSESGSSYASNTIVNASRNVRDPLARCLSGLAMLTFLLTYYIIFDWIYRGYCLYWDGMYITDEDDDEEDEEGGSDVTKDE